MDYNQLTPMMKQYFSIKNDYKDYILLYRLGDFYEMFFEDAVIASRDLEITLTGRNAGLEEKAPLCGVPYHSVDTYIAKLIEKGHKVAICEQTEDPKASKGLVKRDVVKIITPGTLTNPILMDDQLNNFIMAIHMDENELSYVYGDISTFEIYGKSIKMNSHYIDELTNEIVRINPKEILMFNMKEKKKLEKRLGYVKYYFTELPSSYFNHKKSIQRIKEMFKSPSLISLGLDESSSIIPALGALIEYIKETQKIVLNHFGTLKILSDSDLLILDQSSVSNLELLKTLRTHDKKGSLTWVLDHTKTAMGSRMLKKWLLSPLRNIHEINHRLSCVEALKKNDMLRDDIEFSLSKIYDLERLVSKLIYGQIFPKDFIAIKNSLSYLPQLKKTLSLFAEEEMKSIGLELDLCEDVCSLIERSIMEESPALMKDGGYIKPDFNDEISHLKNILSNGNSIILEIERKERDLTGIKNLKIKYNKIFGYYFDITNSNSHLVPDHYIRKQTLANSERYITEDLKTIEEEILTAKEKTVKLESQIFNDIKERIKMESTRLLLSSSIISQIDVLASFAIVARQNNYVRPEFNSTGLIDIQEGRHPVVEKIVGQDLYVSNDTSLDNDSNQFFIITGPNMAGKSTYLRQVALISIMAQMGSFVPALKANLPLLDRIFTRVGASDDLTQGQSTFMVEMSELANILKYSTDHSLVLLDEIGRGTSTYDGLSIAWSVVEYLTDGLNAKPKSLFATHYHELTELEGQIAGVKNYNITVKEFEDDILFLRKIVKGSANQSYGIQVAQLAGVPRKVILNAKRILKELESTDIAKIPKFPGEVYQPSFFKETDGELIKELINLDINQMTPIEALNELSRLIKTAKSKE